MMENFQDDGSIEPVHGIDTLDISECSDRSDIHYDFSAWDKFRRSVKSVKSEARERRSTLLVHFGSSSNVNDDDDDDDDDANADAGGNAGCDAGAREDEDNHDIMIPSPSLPSTKDDVASSATEDMTTEEESDDNEVHDGGNPATAGSSSFIIPDPASGRAAEAATSPSPLKSSSSSSTSRENLTAKERYENGAWRMRLMVGSVFEEDYKPKGYEKKEMAEIVEFLDLKDPHYSSNDDNANGNGNSDTNTNQDKQQQHQKDKQHQHRTEQEVTQRAISSVFFPESNEQKSVLLKRGPVLANGEERELMVFTNGFLLSRVDLGTLVNLLLDVDDGLFDFDEGSGSEDDELSLDMLCERFRAIDVDGSGSLNCAKISNLFRGMGMALSETTLESLMKRFDSNSSGTIELDEFKAMLNSIRHPNAEQAASAASFIHEKFSWGAFLRKALGMATVTRKLDVAYRMSDIDMIENIGKCYGKECDDSDWARRSFALYLKNNENNVDEPVLVTCAKPGHVEPWMETFRTCITSKQQQQSQSSSSSPSPSYESSSGLPEEEFDSGRIYGLPDDHGKKNRARKNIRASMEKWKGSAIDWGQDDSDSDCDDDDGF